MSTTMQTQRIPRADLERMLREIEEILACDVSPYPSGSSAPTYWYRDRLRYLLGVARGSYVPVAQDQVEEKDKSTPDRYGYPYHGEQIPDGKTILDRLQAVLLDLAPYYGTEPMNAVAVAMGLGSVK